MELGFILKKTIGIMIMPVGIVLLSLLIGLIVLYKNRLQPPKFLIVGFVALILFSYKPVANSLMNSLEKQYPKLQTVPKNVEYIVLLGGDFENRAWEVLRIYNKNKHLKIITSGYKGNRDIPDALRSANIFQSLGIPKEDIIVHSKPKDTKEEAIKIKEILGDKPFILVTSAYHMPRAMGLFQKQGTNPIAAPANKEIRKIDFLSIPNAKSLYFTHIALHEYIGLLWAKLRGEI